MRSSRFSKFVRRSVSLGLLGLLVFSAAGCRLVISTDHRGEVSSESGRMDCAQDNCIFEITERVSDTFTAVPAEGYRFVRWTGICERTPLPVCDATVIPLPEELLEYDGDVTLAAEFETHGKKRTWFRDADGDHFGAANESITKRRQPEGYVVNNLDCDDSDASVYPWTDEVEDQRDNNCNGRVDEGFVKVRFWRDRDNDGYGNPDISRLQPRRPEGYVRNRLDCNDRDAEVNPAAIERPDGYDNNCDGEVDDGVAATFYRDVDGDGYGTSAETIESLEPVPGYVSNDADCDDNNAGVSPDAEERFDSVDNNCNGAVDEGFAPSDYYEDSDGDGFGDPESYVSALERPEGYVADGTDNCVDIANPTQGDVDNDGLGDACDPFTDSDGDEIQDSLDNCPVNYNPNQYDRDNDGLGDACDSRNDLDPDNDGVNSAQDNCPEDYNPSQSDNDGDGIGDACDSVDDSPVDGGDPGDGEDPIDVDPPVVGSGCMTAEDQAMLAAVNDFRSQNRSCGSEGQFEATTPLTWSCELEAAALTHSMDMATNDFFEHAGSDGSSAGDRVTRTGYRWNAVGENIAAGGSFSAVENVMQAWIGSPGHCSNLMRDSYSELGAAKYGDSGSTYGVYWTQVFARPR